MSPSIQAERDAERFGEPTPNGSPNTAAQPDHATAREVEVLRAQLESARAEIERERELSAFLKSQIEEANRNAGELRAALREALRAMPKQLGPGTPDAAPQSARNLIPHKRPNRRQRASLDHCGS